MSFWLTRNTDNSSCTLEHFCSWSSFSIPTGRSFHQQPGQQRKVCHVSYLIEILPRPQMFGFFRPRHVRECVRCKCSCSPTSQQAAPLPTPLALMLRPAPLVGANKLSRGTHAPPRRVPARAPREVLPGLPLREPLPHATHGAEPCRAFLAAVSRGRKRMEPAVFVAELRQRLQTLLRTVGAPSATACSTSFRTTLALGGGKVVEASASPPHKQQPRPGFFERLLQNSPVAEGQ